MEESFLTGTIHLLDILASFLKIEMWKMNQGYFLAIPSVSGSILIR